MVCRDSRAAYSSVRSRVIVERGKKNCIRYMKDVVLAAVAKIAVSSAVCGGFDVRQHL